MDGSDLWVTNRSGDANQTFGPFPSGTNVKITEAPGTTGKRKNKKKAVAANIKLNSDAYVFTFDALGRKSPRIACLVPPAPK